MPLLKKLKIKHGTTVCDKKKKRPNHFTRTKVQELNFSEAPSCAPLTQSILDHDPTTPALRLQSCAHTSLGGLERLALAGRPLAFVVQHPDGDVVDAVRLQARQAALAAVPRERQRLFQLPALLLSLVQAVLTAVVHLRGENSTS